MIGCQDQGGSPIKILIDSSRQDPPHDDTKPLALMVYGSSLNVLFYDVAYDRTGSMKNGFGIFFLKLASA